MYKEFWKVERGGETWRGSTGSVTGFKTEILGLCGSVGGDEFEWIGNGSETPLQAW